MSLRAGFAQISPVWLDGAATLDKVADWIGRAADEKVELLAFGEALAPGYPFWPDLTGGAEFDSSIQQDLFAHYARNAVDVAGGQLAGLERLCRDRGIAVYLGVIERATDRSAHSLYASLVYIDPRAGLASVHRKLMPTYEERLVWSPGDGHGLRVHPLGEFRVGGLNCWENWMPLARASLYAQGENLHVAAWPGSRRNTEDITRFMAREGRSFVISVSGLLHRDDIPEAVPHRQRIVAACRERGTEWLADGGSGICGPDGEWRVAPVLHEECLQFVDLELDEVYRARHDFDPAGHYSRPDVTHLVVDRSRQTTVLFEDD